MIKINDLKKQAFEDITMLLGERWFDSHSLEDNKANSAIDLVNVIIDDAVIVKARANGDVLLDLGGRLATIPRYNYYLIEIF